MLGPASLEEVLTVGPKFMGVPKIKSAFVTFVAMHKTKINIIEIVFFIFDNLSKEAACCARTTIFYYGITARM